MPAAGTPGRIYYPTDGIEPSIDSGTVWLPMARPQITWPPLASTWTRFYAGGSVSFTDIPGGGIVFNNVIAAAATTAAVYGQPVTAGSFTATCVFKFSPIITANGTSNTSMSGIAIIDSVSAKAVLLLLGVSIANSGIWPYQTPNGTTFTQIPTTQGCLFPPNSAETWMRIVEAGGTRSYQVSFTAGLIWITMYTEAAGTYTTPTHCGVFLDRHFASNSMLLSGWSVTSP